MAPYLSIALLLALAGPASAPVEDPRAQAIVPFAGEEVAVVIHLDLSKLNVENLARRLLVRFADADQVDEPSRAVARWFAALRQAGAKDLFVLVDPADIPSSPVAVVPLGDGADAQAIGQLLCGGGNEKPLYTWPTCATVHHAVFAGTTAALERVRSLKPAPRPELAAAVAASGDSPAQVLIVPSASQRRVFEEMVPTLPRELGGGPMTTITHGLRWASIALETEPKATLRVVVQSQDAAAAQALNQLGKEAVKHIGELPLGRPGLPDLTKDLAQLKAEVSKDQITINIDLEQATALVGFPLLQAREAARRAQCMNNLKQIGLAMHNYLDAHKAFFPPACSRDKDGRPLLSWRVHLLPYIEQESLYKEFHLDEPWDSPHNKTLIARIPRTYICPSASRKLAASGKTTYLVPRGKATIFADGTLVKISDITDGTSNTILAVDAGDDRAVVWTKPDDWEVGPEPDIKAFVGHHPGGTTFLFADGSARFLKEAVKRDVLKALLSRNGGEVINSEDL